MLARDVKPSGWVGRGGGSGGGGGGGGVQFFNDRSQVSVVNF